MEKLLLLVLCIVVVCTHARPRMPEKETKSTAEEVNKELFAM